MDSSKQFVEELVEATPSLRTLYDEHLSDHKELLPHVFMGDLTRYTLDLQEKVLEHGDTEARRVLTEMLGLLENGMTEGSEKVKELIAVSFLENLDQDHKVYQSLKGVLGPRLREELKFFE